MLAVVPRDLQVLIFQYFPPTDLISFATISKQIKEIVESDAIWVNQPFGIDSFMEKKQFAAKHWIQDSLNEQNGTYFKSCWIEWAREISRHAGSKGLRSCEVTRPSEGSTFTQLFKVSITGSPRVGKTSLSRVLRLDPMPSTYKPTIGVDFCNQQLVINGKGTNLQIWDLAGEPRYEKITAGYLRHSIIIIVFDLTDRSTFDDLPKHFDRIERSSDGTIILVGNKSDLNRCVSRSEAEAIAKKKSVYYREVTATSPDSVFQMFASAAALYCGYIPDDPDGPWCPPCDSGIDQSNRGYYIWKEADFDDELDTLFRPKRTCILQ